MNNLSLPISLDDVLRGKAVAEKFFVDLVIQKERRVVDLISGIG